MKGTLELLCGPSGVGKSSSFGEKKKAYTYTTREPRPNEVDGVDRRFVSQSEFERLVNEGLILAPYEAFGNRYGFASDLRVALLNGDQVAEQIGPYDSIDKVVKEFGLVSNVKKTLFLGLRYDMAYRLLTRTLEELSSHKFGFIELKNLLLDRLEELDNSINRYLDNMGSFHSLNYVIPNKITVRQGLTNTLRELDLEIAHKDLTRKYIFEDLKSKKDPKQVFSQFLWYDAFVIFQRELLIGLQGKKEKLTPEMEVSFMYLYPYLLSDEREHLFNDILGFKIGSDDCPYDPLGRNLYEKMQRVLGGFTNYSDSKSLKGIYLDALDRIDKNYTSVLEDILSLPYPGIAFSELTDTIDETFLRTINFDSFEEVAPHHIFSVGCIFSVLNQPSGFQWFIDSSRKNIDDSVKDNTKYRTCPVPANFLNFLEYLMQLDPSNYDKLKPYCIHLLFNEMGRNKDGLDYVKISSSDVNPILNNNGKQVRLSEFASYFLSLKFDPEKGSIV